MTEKTHPFIEYLESLRDDRGALAALRRGLGQPPGTAASMYRYVVPWLTADVKSREEATYYLIAALFAYHPKEGGQDKDNMGTHFVAVRRQDPNADHAALERRFTTLLAAHPDDLDTYLRQAIGFLRSKEVPVNWHQLFYDLRRWSYDHRPVQKEWARAFWGRPQETQATEEE
jgi:CRISPR system Cascade subunit CasB